MRTLEWYLDRLPETIEYKWLGTGYAPLGTLRDGEEDKKAIGWTNLNDYEYGLEIYKRNGNWNIVYTMEGWDGDTEGLLQFDDLFGDEIIKAQDLGLRFENSLTPKFPNIRDAVEYVWKWLVSKGLVKDE